MVSRKINKVGHVASSKSFAFEESWNKLFSTTTAKLIQLLRPEPYDQKNGLKGSQIQQWYLNEKMVVVPVCLNRWCCFSECAHAVSYQRNEGDEPLPLLAFEINVVIVVFLKYSKVGKSSANHVEIWNALSDVYCDYTKHYQVLSEKWGR